MLPEGPDRAFVQDLAYTTVRRFRALRSVLGHLVPRWPKGEMEALLLVGAAQILYMPDVPDFAAVNETVTAAKGCPNKSVAKVVGEENAVVCGPQMIAEDFCYYTEHAKCVFFNLGARVEDDSKVFPLHSDHVLFDERAMEIGASVLVQTAVDLLDALNA